MASWSMFGAEAKAKHCYIIVNRDQPQGLYFNVVITTHFIINFNKKSITFGRMIDLNTTTKSLTIKVPPALII
jgi:hypothetical protein